MKTSGRTVLATIVMLVFAGAIVRSTLADSRWHQTPDSATATKAEGSRVSSYKESYTLEVNGSKQWKDTGLDLRGGEKVQITAEGTVTYAKGNQFGPAGISRSI